MSPDADLVAAYEDGATTCHAPPVRDCCARAGIAAVLRQLAAALLDDDRAPTGHDDLCNYGPPGTCDCCRGQHYRWLIAQAEQLGARRGTGAGWGAMLRHGAPEPRYDLLADGHYEDGP